MLHGSLRKAQIVPYPLIREAFKDAEEHLSLPIFPDTPRSLPVKMRVPINELLGKHLNNSRIDPDLAIGHKPDGVYETLRSLGLQENTRAKL